MHKDHEALMQKFGQAMTVDIREHNPERNELYFAFRDWLRLGGGYTVLEHEPLLMTFYFDAVRKVPNKFRTL